MDEDEDGDDELIYYAMPEDEELRKPLDIDIVDGEEGEHFVAVLWRNITGDDHIKEYEVNGHLVFVGCSSEEAMSKNGKFYCGDKDLFLVLHPIDEWLQDHIIEVEET